MGILVEGSGDYARAADLIAQLPRLLEQRRTELGLTVKQQATQAKVTSTTLARLYAGSTPTQPTILAALRWLATH